MDLSIVAPCYNEEEAIPLFYKEFRAVLEKMRISYEFIFVDDGSTDGTLAAVKKLREKDKTVHFISFSRNFGQDPALIAGLQKSTGGRVLTTDVDLQDPPALLPEMWRAVSSGGYDSCATRRLNRAGEKKMQSLMADLFYRILHTVSQLHLRPGTRNFWLLSRPHAQAVLSLPEHNRFYKGNFTWVGFKVKWFEYENTPRASGASKWSLAKLIRYALTGIVGFSNFPLGWPSIASAVLGAIAAVMLVVGCASAFWGAGVSDLFWIFFIGFFLAAIQMLAVGILGLYLANINNEVKRRPLYIVREEK